MSTILEALRKLEKEQARPVAPGPTRLDREIAAEQAPVRQHPLRRFALVTTALALSALAGVTVTLAGLSYWQQLASEAPSEDVAAASAEPPSVAEAEAEAEADTSRTEVPSVVVVADVLREEMRELQVEPMSEPAVEPVAVAQIVREPSPATQLAAVREARVSRVPSQAPAAPRPQVFEVEPVPARPVPVDPPRVAVEPPLPVIVRDPVPAVMAKRTTWHPRRDRRRVELSVVEAGESRIVEMREGEFLGPLELVEIGPTGITFLHEGVEIQHRVGAKGHH